MHIHTYYSDGKQSPADVVDAARAAGLGLISVTDHDCMGASEEVKSLASEAGIKAVDGIEISAYTCVKVHTLGYGLDKTCTAFRNYYKKSVEGSFERCRDILKKLSSRGINLSEEEVLAERTKDGTPVHSMFICRAAAKKGYARNAGEFYLSYLVGGKCAYSDVGRVSPFEAVRVITECGGIASLAHPGRIFLDEEQKEKLIKTLADNGLRGIEAVYSGHTERETAYYKEIAQKYNLLVTGGSDTHYAGGSRSIGTPAFCPDEELLDALKIL